MTVVARAVLVVSLLSSTMAPSSAAMTVPAFSEAELRAHADVVVEGVVTSSTTRRFKGRVLTFFTVVSGAAPQLTSTLVAVPGGEFGGVVQAVPGSPQLQVGSRYRLYLGKADGPRLDDSGAHARTVFGFFRGVFLLDGGGGGSVVDVVPFGDDGLPVRTR